MAGLGRPAVPAQRLDFINGHLKEPAPMELGEAELAFGIATEGSRGNGVEGVAGCWMRGA